MKICLVRLRLQQALQALSSFPVKLSVRVVLVALLASPALAQQNNSTSQSIINVRNAGAFACGDVLSALSASGREVEKTAFLQWAAAYATAAARSNGLIDVFPLDDTGDLVRMTALVCRENMKANYETALRAAIGRLRGYWIRQSAEIITLNDPNGRTKRFYAEAVSQLQRDLQRLGTLITVDGAYGNQTGNAIRKMNVARGAEPWLTPDGEVLYILTLPENG